MAASNRSIDEVMAILRAHLDRETIKRIVTDLQRVKGNASFEQTMRLLAERVK